MEHEQDPNAEDGQHGSDDDKKDQPKNGRRKIKIELIEDKSRRHITFSKRKLGIMKKAWELATLTGTQVLLLVASETGHVYTFATPKLQPLITKPEGKNLIQSCLNAPEQTTQIGSNARAFEQQFSNEQQHIARYQQQAASPYPPQPNYGKTSGGYFPATGGAASADAAESE